MHLRQKLADGFSRGAKAAHVSNTVLSAVLDVLLMGTVLKTGVANVERKAAMAEARTGATAAEASPIEASRLALAGLEAPLAAEELPALEVRLAEGARSTAASWKYAAPVTRSSVRRWRPPRPTSSMTADWCHPAYETCSPNMHGSEGLHSTSMIPDDWNQQDDFILSLASHARPLEQGFERLESVLDVIDALDAELRPDSMYLTTRRLKYSRQTLRKRLSTAAIGHGYSINLARSHPPHVNVWLNTWGGQSPGYGIDMRISPFVFVREPEHAGPTAEHLVSFVRALASRLPLSFGLGHSFTDLCLGTDPRTQGTPPPLQEVFWLNVYGPAMVQSLGRERVLSTPASLMEELPGGAVLFLTRPTPADFDAEEARLAQARALVHLRPELSLDATLNTLRLRSLEFVPVPMEFDPDVADILRLEVDFQGVLGGKRKLIERFNQYRPPPVSEWLAASQAPAPDVDDVKAAIDTYEGLYAERLIALFHTEVPQVMDGTLEALPRLDWHLWHSGWGRNISPEQRETLVPALGAFLGRYLVEALGGRWLPRKKLEEAAVVVGDRAWLPFLRARHALQGQEAPLDFSCSHLLRTAQRLARPHAH